MKIPSDIDVTTPYVPQKATIYVRRKQESLLSDTSVSTFLDSEWDSIRSSTLNNQYSQLRGCLKIRTFEESLQCSYASKSTTANHVRWSGVDVYLHTFVLGDHPCPIMGPPTTISWEAHAHQHLSVDDFEGHRRKQQRDIICPTIREHILLQAGYSKWELSRAIHEARKIRMSRARSQNDKLRNKASNKPLFSWLSRARSVKTVDVPIPAPQSSLVR